MIWFVSAYVLSGSFVYPFFAKFFYEKGVRYSKQPEWDKIDTFLCLIASLSWVTSIIGFWIIIFVLSSFDSLHESTKEWVKK